MANPDYVFVYEFASVVITDASYRVLYHTDASRTGTIVHPSEEPRASVVIETPLKVSDWKLIYIYTISPKLLVIRNLAFFMVALSFLLAIGFSLYLGYSITKPIIQLHRKMKLIKIGDYNARASIKSHDEIGFLGDQFNRMAGTIQQLIENDLRLQLINKETQIRALQAQISPHFLYNTLQTISSIAMVRQVPEIKTVSQSLGNMYRYNMKITNEGVSIQEEVMHAERSLWLVKSIHAGLSSFLRVNARYGISAVKQRLKAIPDAYLEAHHSVEGLPLNNGLRWAQYVSGKPPAAGDMPDV